MTIIQPNRTTTLTTAALYVLVLSVALCAIVLVMLYNDMVNFKHGIVEVQKEVRAVQAESAELKETTFNLFNSQNLERVAAERQLVKDREPRYLTPETQWSLVSR